MALTSTPPTEGTTVSGNVPYTQSPIYVTGYTRGESGAVYALAYEPNADSSHVRDSAAEKAADAASVVTSNSERSMFITGYVTGWDEWLDNSDVD
jgi:hypothetical protein